MTMEQKAPSALQQHVSLLYKELKLVTFWLMVDLLPCNTMLSSTGLENEVHLILKKALIE